MSHYLLGHVFMRGHQDIMEIRREELQADKYGAFLMLRAGYDICKGRTMFVTFKDMFGDTQDQDHPSLAFRIDQLNLNCK